MKTAIESDEFYENDLFDEYDNYKIHEDAKKFIPMDKFGWFYKVTSGHK